MSVEITVPALGESVTEATVARWLKAVGEPVKRDEPVVELETDKVTLEVNAPAEGVIEAASVGEGETVEVGAVLGTISEGAAPAAKKEAEEQKPAAETSKKEEPAKEAAEGAPPERGEGEEPQLMPAARKLVEEHGLDPQAIRGTGKGGRITKEDVLAHLEAAPEKPAGKEEAPKPAAAERPASGEAVTIDVSAFERPSRAPAPERDREERVRMTKLRKTIASRLKQAQNTAAMLTTFNEVDMTNAMALRREYRDVFEKKHGIRLGFMSIFVKAVVRALQELPAVNAEIDGEEIVYKNYYDIGVAVGTPQGLVVPVVRDCDRLGFAEIEKTITGLGKKARDGKLTMPELTGGTFTITNGGIYGSLMSTPILNPPQSGILGMHKIMDRPMVVDGQMVPRPMMYVALSYDHRIVDGAEAVTFLVRVKEGVEDPRRLLLEI
ncbi:MAG: 2-oxoglutarate dehydrogenase complex dihydrolipoyllysine-residue succinyltransferase [Alphaproteobacteria bacterium]|jgi:2-oxoglutarate dehydrogenase E2 component (dihydrolipoamide succinyltransferase)|nr:2-oxoglutarate dehydrogenase complex dihydrolipoyllysine-residue succinyltransferase [Alphaproteobacteria bacterium]